MAVSKKQIKLAKDSNAMLKLDTLSDKEDPYKGMVGGKAYAREEHAAMRTVLLYDGIEEEKEKKSSKVFKVLAVVIALATVAGLMVAIGISMM